MTDRFLNDITGIKLYFCSSGVNFWELQPLHLQDSQIRAHPPNCRVESDSEIGSTSSMGAIQSDQNCRPPIQPSDYTVNMDFAKWWSFCNPITKYTESNWYGNIWYKICLSVSRHFSLQETGPALSNSQKYWSQEMWGRSRCCSTEHQSVKHWNASKFKRHTVLNWLPGLFKMFSKADLLFSQKQITKHKIRKQIKILSISA